MIFFFFQAEDGIRDLTVTGVQTCALPISQIGEYYGRYRLHQPEAERAMARSLDRYGQLSPVVVCQREGRSEEHTSELQSQSNLVCRLLLEKKKTTKKL